MNSNQINKVVIVGGGTAGWMAAAAVSRLIGANLDITLIESDAIGTIGVGEATIPTFLTLHRLLKIDEAEFMARVNGTFKLGISFEGWLRADHDYVHSFGYTGQGCWAAGFQHFWTRGSVQGMSHPYGRYSPEMMALQDNRFSLSSQNPLNYAYHIDATEYAQFLRTLAQRAGVKRVEGKIVSVGQHASGFIKEVILESGTCINGDFFIDCSGFYGLLADKTLGTAFDDWSQWLPCNRAVAVQTEAVRPSVPYTRAIARSAGWQWQIPLQHRVGNGLVFDANSLSDDEARHQLLNSVEGRVLTEPRVIKFRTGQRVKHWAKNCVALGLAAGFLEPMESTSIHLIQRGIIRLMQMFPSMGIRQADEDEFNRQMSEEFLFIRDFIIMHYHLNRRDESPFWSDLAHMSVPEALQHRLDLFRETGNVFQKQGDVFGENSWTQVMMGQGILPKTYHPIVDMMQAAEFEQFMAVQRAKVDQALVNMPKHADFVAQYCPGNLSKN